MAADPRPSWIALATDGAVVGLGASLGPDRLLVTGDPTVFDDRLISARPRIAILAAPPATVREEQLVISERQHRPRLRIVHLTHPDDLDGRIEAVRLGFDEALATSIDDRELLERLRILDERAGAGRGPEIPVGGGVVLDRAAHEVRRDGSLIHLRPKEFRLLAMLAAHPGRAYTRRQLLDRVWGPDHVGDPRTVDVHVRWLRSKIELTPARPVHLVTVRGVGYRLDPGGR
jgi:DNA-binding response OmpR family regulator